jgi:hypothetical protein
LRLAACSLQLSICMSLPPPPPPRRPLPEHTGTQRVF